MTAKNCDHVWTVADWMNDENERWVRWVCSNKCGAEQKIETPAFAGAAPS